MGKRGDGYGSEDYFLKNRTTRCEEFDCALLSAMDVADCKLEWMYRTGARGEREPQGLTFLKDKGTLALWSKYWPQRGRAQIGRRCKAAPSTGTEWVLIEAKANTVEFVTPPCGASKLGGRGKIEKALNRLKSYLGVHRFFPWLGTYYQYAQSAHGLTLPGQSGGSPCATAQRVFRW